MLAERMAEAIAGAPLRALDDLSRDLWRAHGAGVLTDDEAQALAETIHARRSRVRAESVTARPPATTATATATATRTWSYFPPKRPQRLPDRERSLQRRRQLAASGPMPPDLACRFTTGELAVLRIVADEVRRWGVCGLCLREIAARAGVGLTKARMAVREAAGQGLVVIEERRQHCRPNLPNVVRVISREWLAWIAKGKVTQRTANPCPSVTGLTVRCAPAEGAKGADCKSAGLRLHRSPGGGSTFLEATDKKGFRRRKDADDAA